LSNYNSELTGIAAKKFLAFVAVNVLSAVAQQHQAKQSYAQSRQMAQMSALNYANKSNTGLAGYSSYMQNFKSSYTPSLSYAHITPPTSISEKSSVMQKKAYAKAKIAYYKERLEIINSTLSCYESSSGSDIHTCIQGKLKDSGQE
jgi:flagellar hook assembly protein FlgD